MRQLWGAVLIAMTLATGAVAQAETKVVKVNGMVCSFCAQGIEKTFKARAEVKNVHVDLKAKSVAIDFQDGKSIPDSEIEKILKDAGYAVVKN